MTFKKIQIPYGDKYCDYYLNKDGTYKYYPLYHISKYHCLMKKIYYFETVQMSDFYGINNDVIISKLLIFLKCTKYKIGYFKYKDNYVLYRTDVHNIEDIMAITLLLLSLFKKSNNLNILYIAYRISSSHKISDENIFTRIFYTEYANKERLKEYNIDSNSISNYNALYKLLKKKKIVNYYYKVIVPNILKNYKTLYSIIMNTKEFKQMKNKIKKLFKKFNKKVILKWIDKFVYHTFDKKYIKNKFNELSKKYNM